MKMIEQFTPDAALTRLAEINAWVQAAPQKYAAEYYSSFNEFIDTLKANMISANGEVAGDALQDPLLRAKLNYVAAIYRDCRYSLMHRGRLQELGIHNMFRETYEVGRAAKTAENL
jgi:hypothetical protein